MNLEDIEKTFKWTRGNPQAPAGVATLYMPDNSHPRIISCIYGGLLSKIEELNLPQHFLDGCKIDRREDETGKEQYYFFIPLQSDNEELLKRLSGDRLKSNLLLARLNPQPRAHCILHHMFDKYYLAEYEKYAGLNRPITKSDMSFSDFPFRVDKVK